MKSGGRLNMSVLFLLPTADLNPGAPFLLVPTPRSRTCVVGLLLLYVKPAPVVLFTAVSPYSGHAVSKSSRNPFFLFFFIAATAHERESLYPEPPFFCNTFLFFSLRLIY